MILEVWGLPEQQLQCHHTVTGPAQPSPVITAAVDSQQQFVTGQSVDARVQADWHTQTWRNCFLPQRKPGETVFCLKESLEKLFSASKKAWTNCFLPKRKPGSISPTSYNTKSNNKNVENCSVFAFLHHTVFSLLTHTQTGKSKWVKLSWRSLNTPEKNVSKLETAHSQSALSQNSSTYWMTCIPISKRVTRGNSGSARGQATAQCQNNPTVRVKTWDHLPLDIWSCLNN